MDGWEEFARQREEQQRQQDQREHRTIAQLLVARGLDRAAALVASSEYRSDQVDSYDGGQFESVFSVPPAWFDYVDDPTRTAIEEAARAVVDEGHFSGIRVAVMLAAPESGWAETMVREIVERLRQHQDTGPTDPGLELLSGPAARPNMETGR